MKMFSKKMLGMLVLLGISTASCADDTGMYIYGGIGEAIANINQGQVDSRLTSVGATGLASSVNSNPSAYKLQLGYQFNQYWAIEGGYAAIGNLTYSGAGFYGGLPFSDQVSEKADISNLSVAGTLPFGGGFSGTGRLGYASVHTTANAQGMVGGTPISSSATVSKSAVTYGFGLKYDINEKVSLRADVDFYNAPSAAYTGNFNIWTIGAGYKF